MARHRRSSLIGLLIVARALHAQTPGADTQHVTHAPPSLRAPEQVGRFTRGELHDFGSAEGGVAYQYSAAEDSTRLTIYLYRRSAEERSATPADAIKGQSETFKQALDIERSRGTFEDYGIAFENKTSVETKSGELPGYEIVFALRRNGAVFVSMFFIYAVEDAFIKIRGTVPESRWEQTDIPSFARAFVAEAVSGRKLAP